MIATQASSPPPAFQSPSSPPRTPRRPSMSNPMSWLGRTHAHTPSTTMRISEPKLVSDMFTPTGGTTYSAARYGVLGTGATVVRTPQDALARAMLHPPSDDDEDDDDVSSYEDEPEPPSPASPPLPALPFTSKSSPDLPVLGELPAPSSPVRAPPAAPVLPLKAPSPAPAPASVLPLNVPIAPTPPQPPCAPVLLAPVPPAPLVLPSLLVTLETSTSALRTTYATLTARPSHLADYLRAVVQRPFRDTLVEVDEEEEEEDEEDDGHKLSSPSTPFQSLFAAHLTAAGLLPQSAGMLHLFLDRPSAPYTHILTYLRAPVEHPALPRAAALGPHHAPSYDARLEALLELRDEARYLGLDELHRLCCDELRQRQGHVRGGGAGSNASSGSGQVVVHERGRDAGLVRLGAIARREVKQAHVLERDSTGSEVAHVEGAPSVRTMSPPAERRVRRSRSRSRGNPRSASDWI